MRRARERTGQSWLSPDLPCPMTSPLTPFFWVVNSKVAKVAFSIWVSVHDMMLRRRVPICSLASWRRKGWDSVLVDVYSPGRRRKKKAKVIMSAVAQLRGVGVAFAMLAIRLMI